MADILPFPTRVSVDEIATDGVIGSRFGLTVRIVAYDLSPDDLFVVLDGPLAERTTIAVLPADQDRLASVIAHSALATIEASQASWVAKTASA